MAENEKLKILYLMKILLEETDKDHMYNAVELAELLEKRYDISCNRKTVYADVERLKTFGIGIEQVKGSRPGFYVENRDFELAELKLVVDAVQSSKFITGKKSEQLIQKLQKLTSKSQAKWLQRQVFIYNRPKTDNETVFENVDVIHTALQNNKTILFKYCEWTAKRELKQKKNGATYEVSPWSLTWDDENYYLVAYDANADLIKHYRVDKMQEMCVGSEERQGKERFSGFDLAAFAKKTFGMYGGQDVKVTLRCDNSLAGVVIDRFGKDTMMIPQKDGHFHAHVLVSVSPQFFGWVTGIGAQMEILSPESVREEYRQYLKTIMKQYNN